MALKDEMGVYNTGYNNIEFHSSWIHIYSSYIY